MATARACLSYKMVKFQISDTVITDIKLLRADNLQFSDL